MENEINPGIDAFKWKSTDINGFIKKAKICVDGLFETVTKMKESSKKVLASLEKFDVKIIERKNKPMPPEEYDQFLKAIFANKISNVKENGQTIHKLVKEVLDAVKVDKKSPQWKNYNDFINSIMIDGVSNAI